MISITVFASSLLTLISPWADSRGARYQRSPVRWPRPVAPPPPPRRHSDPTNTKNTITQKFRRYSDYKNPKKSKLDLRQELINLNLNNQEVNTWLGNEYDEKREYDYEQFQNDIPLQRSVSLDGGIQIFKYLQTLGSDWSGSSVASTWTLDSDKDLMMEKYRSFEDIPASQIQMKSRRTSSDVNFNRNLALSVLKNSYKDIEIKSGSISPRIKKLQRTFSLRNALEDFKNSSRESLSDDGLQNRVPSYKDIPSEMKIEQDGKDKTIRQRRQGIQMNVPYHTDLRKKVLKQNLNYGSLQDLSVKRIEMERRGSAGSKPEFRLGLSRLKDSYKGIEMESGNISPKIHKLKKSFTFSSDVSKKSAVTTASESNLKIKSSVAKYKTSITSNLVEKTKNLVEKTSLIPKILISDSSSFSNLSTNLKTNSSTWVKMPTNIVENTTMKVASTSNLVDVSRNCGCRLCREEGNDKRSFMRRIITKTLLKIMYGSRKLMYWDENNNLNENEMLACLIQVLKFLFGLWLRNLDHN